MTIFIQPALQVVNQALMADSSPNAAISAAVPVHDLEVADGPVTFLTVGDE